MPESDQLSMDVMAESLGDVLLHVGRGIAEAQVALDRNSLATQVLIDNDETLSQTGIEATWYHFPETTIELKVSLSMHWEKEKRPGRPPVWRKVLYAAPQNASYRNVFSFDAASTSVVKTRIVSVPPATTIEAE